ncbi:COMPASS (complex proteins associated with Set1p) component [Elasticomyces elasticus]|uniref:COMPASS (Complex proteins associated with Set1p) component n=1 Tax=Exophiala sideris TaxID=1016849 RepID=A0ABR0J8Q5_9EURO|nr:COMPASS (complex proteins associated with Set1p) component [Elasticomyces elasticus]KAK5025534.1 COMPASS (complex proteins associated with Set1p) component [Exophiala sideris]KAK5029806.1 COMPASS (complex proteins associated with Set1p) component [Exophiala sideris]KAK5058432.1 COMPASS (complex proteins associated with Set1p) component [Exophiala sideris]KAK5178595.1 COMPASS (complex proteins associated with Set1p) component [Eurotiomycetes sp. CCFEE 6388]
MAFGLSELLNPQPASIEESANVDNTDAMDPSASSFFAPELFQPQSDAPLAQDGLIPLSHDVEMTMEDDVHNMHQTLIGNEMADADPVKQEVMDNVYPPFEDENLHGGDSSIMDMVDGSLLADNSSIRDSPEDSTKPRCKHPGKSRKSDANGPPKSSIHSSKNEGQHTDRRYLCYLCNKLFTRRRSVRDHISKIHNTKTWEPVRSLEVIVDPNSGEPIEPLEEIIARGPPPPPPKAPKAPKAEKSTKQEDSEERQETQEVQEAPQEQSAVEDIATAHEKDGTPLPEPQRAPASTPPPPSTIATLKKEPSVVGSRASSTEPFATPAPVAGKKRPAPEDSAKSSTAAKKKGTAKVKSSTGPNKRSKLSATEPSPPARSAYRSPSAAPSLTQLKPIPSKLKKQTSTASVRSSPTPASSRAGSLEVDSRSSSVAATPTSSNDDGEVFCICRKGDNHTWMIACDGGCDEWFHGNCVNIRERDGDLIDKYICPTCTKPGLITTWKRMCRRRDCRKPARVTQAPPSKYCSDACGRMFFVELVQRGDPAVQTSKDGQYVVEPSQRKKLRRKQKRADGQPKAPKPLTNGAVVNGDVADLVDGESRLATPAYSEEDKTEYETDSSLDDDMLPNRGAALRAGEVKALLEKCAVIEQWRTLGRKPDTPPREVDMPDTKTETGAEAESKPATPPEFDELETAKMASIQEEKRKLKERNDMYNARELLLDLVKARSTSITDEVRKTHPKMKDLCGFDPRMAWSDEEFVVWYTQKGGKEVLDVGVKAKIGPPDEHDGSVVNGIADEDEAEDGTMPKKGGVCVKNRCSRHRNWAKSQLAELRFEQDLVRRALARYEAQEKQIRERGMVRAWENRGRA